MPSWRAGLFVVVVLQAGCVLTPLPVDGLDCPCAPGWTCGDAGCERVPSVHAQLVEIPASELNALDLMCADAPDLIWVSCVRAFDRACAASGQHGYALAGSSVTMAGATARGVCLDGTAITTTDAEIAAANPPDHWHCDDPNGYPVRCNSGVHAFCRSRGYASGFGYVENDGTNLTVVCVQSAEVVEITNARQALPMCSIGAINEVCLSAVHQRCLERGAVAGFGPIGYSSSGRAAFVCFY